MKIAFRHRGCSNEPALLHPPAYERSHPHFLTLFILLVVVPSVIFSLLTIPLRLAIFVLYLPSQRAPFLGFTNAALFLLSAYNFGSRWNNRVIMHNQ
jgi:hypothetical protein